MCRYWNHNEGHHASTDPIYYCLSMNLPLVPVHVRKHEVELKTVKQLVVVVVVVVVVPAVAVVMVHSGGGDGGGEIKDMH